MANREQLGAKRQADGNRGASKRRYARTSTTSARAVKAGRATSALGSEIESSRELGGRLGIGEGLRAGLRDHDEVRRRADVHLMLAKRLAEKSLDTVAYDSVPDALAHRDAETGSLAGREPTDHDEVGRVTPPPVALECHVLGTAPEPRGLGVPFRATQSITPAASAGC